MEKYYLPSTDAKICEFAAEITGKSVQEAEQMLIAKFKFSPLQRIRDDQHETRARAMGLLMFVVDDDGKLQNG